jgi:hypothetical protein
MQHRNPLFPAGLGSVVPASFLEGWATIAGPDGIPVAAPSAQKLELQFVLTRLNLAKSALERANRYAKGLEARITILAAQIVPYPLPLERPPVQTALLQQSLSSLASKQPVETSVEIYICRDPEETFRRVLKPESVVIVPAAPHRWWLGPEQRLTRTLRHDGHFVISV